MSQNQKYSEHYFSQNKNANILNEISIHQVLLIQWQSISKSDLGHKGCHLTTWNSKHMINEGTLCLQAAAQLKHLKFMNTI